MQTEFLTQTGSQRLLIFFAGWGMDVNPLRGLYHPDYDILAVWDYRNDEFPFHLVEGYSEICVIAWSYGVCMCRSVLRQLRSRLTRCIAVAGTPWAVDNERGIPEKTFCATAEALSETSLQKFYLRMCGSREAYERFMQHAPHRPISELREELSRIGIVGHPRPGDVEFDFAIIPTDDKIIPTVNQVNAWESTPFRMIKGGHLIDLQEIIKTLLIDKPLVEQRFSKASDYDHYAVAQKMFAEHLWSMVHNIPGPGARIIEVGCGTGLFTKTYLPHLSNPKLELWDLVDIPTEHVPSEGVFKKCDAEMAIRRVPDESADMILSNCAVQWFASPRRFVAECARALKPGGILAFSTFDPNNLPQLKMPQLAVPDCDVWKSYLTELFSDIEIQTSVFDLTFDSPKEILSYLKLTGTNAVCRTSLSPSEVRAFITNYPQSDTKKFPLTFLPIYIVCKK